MAGALIDLAGLSRQLSAGVKAQQCTNYTFQAQCQGE
jgi:hypothetical protein